MIKVDNLSYSYPQRDLYKDVSFTLEEGQHCAFIGASGSGKSTLIDIIMDPEKYVFDGNVEMEPSLKIGYVSQFSQRDKDKETTVFEYIAEEFIKLENEIATLCAEMGTSDDIETFKAAINFLCIIKKCYKIDNLLCSIFAFNLLLFYFNYFLSCFSQLLNFHIFRKY